MASSWRRTAGNVRSFVSNSMGGLRGGSNLASWVVAGTLAYFLWVKPSQDLKRQQQVRFLSISLSLSDSLLLCILSAIAIANPHWLILEFLLYCVSLPPSLPIGTGCSCRLRWSLSIRWNSKTHSWSSGSPYHFPVSTPSLLIYKSLYLIAYAYDYLIWIPGSGFDIWKQKQQEQSNQARARGLINL